MCPKMKQLVPQEWFALFECTLVLQQWFTLFGYFVVVGGFGLFGVGVYRHRVLHSVSPNNSWSLLGTEMFKQQHLCLQSQSNRMDQFGHNLSPMPERQHRPSVGRDLGEIVIHTGPYLCIAWMWVAAYPAPRNQPHHIITSCTCNSRTIFNISIQPRSTPTSTLLPQVLHDRLYLSCSCCLGASKHQLQSRAMGRNSAFQG